MKADLGAERLVCRPLPLRELLGRFGLAPRVYYSFFLAPVASAAWMSGPLWAMLWPEPWAVVAAQVELAVVVGGLLVAHDRWTRSRILLALHERGLRYWFYEGERTVPFAELAQIEIGCRWTALERLAIWWASVRHPTLAGKSKPIAQLSLVFRFRSGKRQILRGFLGRFATDDATALIREILVADPALVTVRNVDARSFTVGNPNPSLAETSPMR